MDRSVLFIHTYADSFIYIRQGNGTSHRALCHRRLFESRARLNRWFARSSTRAYLYARTGFAFRLVHIKHRTIPHHPNGLYSLYLSWQVALKCIYVYVWMCSHVLSTFFLRAHPTIDDVVTYIYTRMLASYVQRAWDASWWSTSALYKHKCDKNEKMAANF